MGFLEGKTAIITGAGFAALKDGSAGSIGYGIATAYAKEGANLVITGRIMDCTARFFVNPGAARLDPRVRNLADRLAAAVKDKHFEPVAGSAQ